VLQTLSIIIQNVRSETGTFFLFSNNHINNITDLDYDWGDEEVLGYYISFLKTISMKLNAGVCVCVRVWAGARAVWPWPCMHGVTRLLQGKAQRSPPPRHQPRPPPTRAGTVHFFLNASAVGRHFPLYSRAIRLAHNREGMVRAAVRTLTLHVYSVGDPAIAAFVTAPPASRYFSDVAMYLAEQVQVRAWRARAAWLSMCRARVKRKQEHTRHHVRSRLVPARTPRAHAHTRTRARTHARTHQHSCWTGACWPPRRAVAARR
jgi:protein CLEC16A